MGSNVLSGTARAVVLTTGARTHFGALAQKMMARREPTSFDQGVRGFTWLMIRFMVVMVSATFLIVGLTKGNWTEALLFALSVAVGLTPEMLPMIITVCLSKGALLMARKKVIVKHLHAIQNFGAMDLLCTDKTGTLTQDRVVLERYVDVTNRPSEDVLRYAYMNSFYQTGLRNLLDRAVLAHGESLPCDPVFTPHDPLLAHGAGRPRDRHAGELDIVGRHAPQLGRGHGVLHADARRGGRQSRDHPFERVAGAVHARMAKDNRIVRLPGAAAVKRVVDIVETARASRYPLDFLRRADRPNVRVVRIGGAPRPGNVNGGDDERLGHASRTSVGKRGHAEPGQLRGRRRDVR
jgi:hypothetical protein